MKKSLIYQKRITHANVKMWDTHWLTRLSYYKPVSCVMFSGFIRNLWLADLQVPKENFCRAWGFKQMQQIPMWFAPAPSVCASKQGAFSRFRRFGLGVRDSMRFSEARGCLGYLLLYPQRSERAQRLLLQLLMNVLSR